MSSGGSFPSFIFCSINFSAGSSSKNFLVEFGPLLVWRLFRDFRPLGGLRVKGCFWAIFSACRRLRGWSAALISSLCPTVLTKLILAHIYCRVCHTTGHWNDWRVSGSVEPKVYCLVSANEARLCVYIRVFGCFLMLVTVLDVMKRRVWSFVSGVVVITWWAV